LEYTNVNEYVGKIRKLSLTLNLNGSDEYEGGNLMFDMGKHNEDLNQFYECTEIREKGSLIVFPSYLHHCVTPVTKGTRYSLVLWCLGEAFR
jgi:PKHD-type hydroxylase